MREAPGMGQVAFKPGVLDRTEARGEEEDLIAVGGRQEEAHLDGAIRPLVERRRTRQLAASWEQLARCRVPGKQDGKQAHTAKWLS